MSTTSSIASIKLILITALFTYGATAHAGIVVGGTRIIYDGTKNETSLSVNNPDNSPYLIQAWVDGDGPLGENKAAAKPPFVVTPPLFRLEANNENMIRIIRTGGNLPEDRESIYWANIKSIPATKNGEKNVLQISVKTRIKLFYRPEGIKVPNEDIYKTITFHRSGNQLQVNNPTPYYLTFYSLKVGSDLVKTSNEMVPPKGTATYLLPASATSETVSWQAINDFGGTTKTIHATAQ
jgi:P pilus assembly chaperone PapD